MFLSGFFEPVFTGPSGSGSVRWSRDRHDGTPVRWWLCDFVAPAMLASGCDERRDPWTSPFWRLHKLRFASSTTRCWPLCRAEGHRGGEVTGADRGRDSTPPASWSSRLVVGLCTRGGRCWRARSSSGWLSQGGHGQTTYMTTRQQFGDHLPHRAADVPFSATFSRCRPIPRRCSGWSVRRRSTTGRTRAWAHARGRGRG